MSSSAGAWMRLTGLAAAGATLLAVDLRRDSASSTGCSRRSRCRRSSRSCSRASSRGRGCSSPRSTALGLFGAAALVEGEPLHATVAALAFAATLVACAQTFRGEHVPAGAWRDYVTLTKPRIMTLLLLTGACGMVIGARGLPPASLFVATMLGLALACGGASALNHVLDADIDRLMGKRTEKRPVAAGRIEPGRALEFGLTLSAFSFVLLASAVNVLTAALALVGNLFYVLVYTRWLKRSTPQNIVIGGAAGAVPPLVGWAAATGNLDAAGALPLPDRLLLDAAALLGARAADPRELRGRARADAARRPRRARDAAADRRLHARAHRRDAAAVRLRAPPAPATRSARSRSAARSSS